uniref:VapB-type antitoxin n=1 Tax=Ignisphaera aggregans TaxID=334771 RepID=A0A7J2U3G7_9CREN
MQKYVTISVLKEVKELLEKDRGNSDWSEYLLRLYNEVKELRARLALEELRRLLSDEELDEILKSSKEFRERFRLR